MDVRVGTDGKSDCLVAARRTARGSVSIDTANRDLVEAGIRAIAEATLQALGAPAVMLEIRDQGALDYVLTARRSRLLSE